MSLQERIKERFKGLVEKQEELRLNLPSFDIKEVWKNAQLAIYSIVQIIEEEAVDTKGVEKKQMAMDAISMFYDLVIAQISIPYVPSFLNTSIHKVVKKFYMKAADGAVDTTVTILRKVGVFQTS